MAPAVVHRASTRTISIFTSTDSTATSAIDGNNSSFNRSTTSSTVRTLSPTTLMTTRDDDAGDRAAARVLLHQVADAHHLLALVWADGGYTGSLVEYCLATLALVLVIVKRSDSMRGFVVLPKRWIVERLFAQLMRSRRLVRDFERRTTSAEAMIYWSMTLLMTRRLARSRCGRA
ncbi:transposase [Streptomyces sp. NPDC056231]|uniref:transposase n=1 Tax=Streptomyces sp. NPDC056231 TaxID=3345755 RepID=UPI003AABF3EB